MGNSIKELVARIKYERPGTNIPDIAEAVDIKISRFRDMVYDRVKPPPGLQQKLMDIYLVEKNPRRSDERVRSDLKAVPFIDAYSYFKYGLNWMDKDYISTMPYRYASNMPGGELLYIQMNTDIMDNGSKKSIPEKCVVLAQSIDLNTGIERMKINSDKYFIVFTQAKGFFFGVPGDIKRKSFSIKPLNPTHGYNTFHINEVDQLFIIKQKIEDL